MDITLLWSSSEAKIEANEFKKGTCNDNKKGCGAKCEVEPEQQGIATFFWCIPSALMKSISKNCLLHKYILFSQNED
jgi:hypothetical protein